MNEYLWLLLTGIGGIVLGSIFFGGLWWTVCRGMSSRQPALWFPVSRHRPDGFLSYRAGTVGTADSLLAGFHCGAHAGGTAGALCFGS